MLSFKPSADSTSDTRFDIAKRAKYQIGGHIYSLLDIEFKMLRTKTYIPSTFVDKYGIEKLSEEDPRAPNALSKAEPRINFLVNLGIKTGPSLHIYHAATIYEEMERATRTYLQENIVVDKKDVRLPKMLKLYFKDFAKTEEKLLKALNEYLSAEQKTALVPALALKYRHAHWGFHYNLAHFVSGK
jgi:hypothetical protein